MKKNVYNLKSSNQIIEKSVLKGYKKKYLNNKKKLMVTSPLASTPLPPLSPLVTNLSDLPPSSPR